MDKVVRVLTSVFSTQLGLDEDRQEVVAYSLNLIVSSVISYALIVSAAWLLGILPIALSIAIAHSILRIFAGGAHGSTPIRCYIISVVTFTSLGLILKEVLSFYSFNVAFVSSLVIFLFAIWVIAKNAPADVPDKPIVAKAQRKKLKILSLWVVVIWYSFTMVLLLLTGIQYKMMIAATGWGIFWQSFTLTKPSYGLFGFINKLFVASK